MDKTLGKRIIYEKKIIINHDPITINQTNSIIKQLKESVCKVKIQNTEATGFFCKINYKNKYLPVLITSEHSFCTKDNKNILENMIKTNDKIELTINNGEKKKEINFKHKRKIYTNQIYDTTIIEILPDIDKINNYLSLDEEINDISNNYEGNSIYTLQYPDGNEASVSYGIIEKKENEYEFRHLCSTKSGSSGAPILNLKTNKIIGIHCGQYRFEDYNSGIFLIEPIKEFQQDKKILEINDKSIDLTIQNNKKISRNNNSFKIEEKGNKQKTSSVPKEKETKVIFPPIYLQLVKLHNKNKKDNKTSNFDIDNSPEKKIYNSSSVKFKNINNFKSIYIKKSEMAKFNKYITKNEKND